MNVRDELPYSSGAAMWAAARSRARNAAKGSASSSHDLLRQFVYARFLARLFASEFAEQWVLKGGTAILARAAIARHTADIDLLQQGMDVDDATCDLRAACATDLGDHFRFEVASSAPARAGAEDDVRGATISVDAYCGVRRVDTIAIDLVIGSLMTVEPEIRDATPAFDMPGLPTATFRLYPIVDHLADKVCATEATYGAPKRRSSRVRDLVDIITIARLEDLEAQALHKAIHAERAKRGLPQTTSFHPPEAWRSPYERLAHRSSTCAGLENFDAAVSYARMFLAPVLADPPRAVWWTATMGTWSSD